MIGAGVSGLAAALAAAEPARTVVLVDETRSRAAAAAGSGASAGEIAARSSQLLRCAHAAIELLSLAPARRATTPITGCALVGARRA